MNTHPPTAPASRVVVVVASAHGPDADLALAHLKRQGIYEPEWLASGDLGDLDRAVRRGNVRQVVFPRLGCLLEALWNEEIDLTAWRAAGVRIDVADAGASTESPGFCALLDTWSRFRRARRRRQAVAGGLLSAVALLAAFTVIWLAR